jgi:hypothetical protein
MSATALAPLVTVHHCIGEYLSQQLLQIEVDL